MSIEVLGAGFGRTGTESLKRALEQLGYGPCYHMHELLEHPAHTAFWEAALRRGDADWPALLGPYRAAVDWPAVHFWRQLCAYYPDVRVILNVRDPQRWYQSIARTIFTAQRLPLPPPTHPVYPALVLAREMIRDILFDDRLDDAEHVIGVYERHNAEVERAVPAQRLLVYDVAQGWEPLCAFLDRPVPDAPFPRGNTTEEFLTRIEDHKP